ncbi:MAG: type IV pilus modification protein PilV [Thioalkalivibrionaceae bacterium]
MDQRSVNQIGQHGPNSDRVVLKGRKWPSTEVFGFRNTSGFSLIEVLVAAVVLSVGLLALAAVQINGLKASTDSAYRSQAVVLAEQMFDRMRLEREQALAGSFDVEVDEDGEEVVPQAVEDWIDQVRTRLPAGSGDIQRVGSSVVVRVRWQNRFGDRDGEAEQHTLTLRSEL